MSKKEKLFRKFLAKPYKKDITFAEMETLMSILGYAKIEGDGSRIKFFNKAITYIK